VLERHTEEQRPYFIWDLKVLLYVELYEAWSEKVPNRMNMQGI